MYCYLKKQDGTEKRVECSASEEALCAEFCQKYTVRYRSATEGLYGMEHTPVTLSEYIHECTPSEMECILAEQDGVKTVIGCVCGGRSYYLNGIHRYDQENGPGPQDALIWEYKEWVLVERKK